MALYHRPVFRRHWWCRSCEICVARRAWQSCGTLCGDSAGRVRKHCRVRGRIGDLVLSDDHCVVRHQSQKTGTIHPVFCGRTHRDLLHVRRTTVRHEYEPGTNIRLSTSRELWARALDLFHSSVDACWPPARYFFESAGAPPHIAPNFTTLTMNAVSSITPNTRFREEI